ncbi:MAG: hypothetical protein QOH97_5809 [Actinoplanes sp.]|jgi:NAD(P)-dependent dehydrogenase (short-subunit alcohol dehydrogenase family)|nr:hypothetical protein [Actinoplanes sp.]
MSAYEQVLRRYQRLEVICNNMGLMDPGDRSALDTSLDTWRRVHDANLTSIFLACKHGIPRLRDTEPTGGSVINAASFLAVTGAATAQMAYAAAKAAVVQLTRYLGVHLARSGVRVNASAVSPTGGSGPAGGVADGGRSGLLGCAGGGAYGLRVISSPVRRSLCCGCWWLLARQSASHGVSWSGGSGGVRM